MKLVGANQAANVTALDELPGKSNYFVGNDPGQYYRDWFVFNIPPLGGPLVAAQWMGPSTPRRPEQPRRRRARACADYQLPRTSFSA